MSTANDAHGASANGGDPAPLVGVVGGSSEGREAPPIASPTMTTQRRLELPHIWPRREGTPDKTPQIEAAIGALLHKLEPTLPDLVASVRNGWVSFDDLTDAYEGRDAKAKGAEQKALKNAYIQIYPFVRQTFVVARGELLDLYPSPRIQAYAAITKPARKPRWFSDDPRPDFHFVYDLASAPVAGQMFSRITQLAYDARRIVPIGPLAECLSQLYSATTDLLGIIEEHSEHTDPSRELDKISIVQRDLDQVELRYLQITARLWYFLGVMSGTALALVGAFAIGTAGSIGSVEITAIMFAAVGATLSVVQKMSDDTLVVKYVVGPFYLFLLGLARPVIGAFAGFLLQLAITAGLIPLALSGAAGQAYILLSGFAVGWAERSIPDIFTRAGLSRGLPSDTSNSTSPSSFDARDQAATTKRARLRRHPRPSSQVLSKSPRRTSSTARKRR
jgi:hypothetical protein